MYTDSCIRADREIGELQIWNKKKSHARTKIAYHYTSHNVTEDTAFEETTSSNFVGMQHQLPALYLAHDNSAISDPEVIPYKELNIRCITLYDLPHRVTVRRLLVCGI